MCKINMIPISQKVKLNPGSNSSLQVYSRMLHFQPISQTIAPSIIPISTNGTTNPPVGQKPWNHSALLSLLYTLQPSISRSCLPCFHSTSRV